MKQYEFGMLDIPWNWSRRAIISELNEWGSVGWSCVGIVTSNSTSDVVTTYLMQKEKK